MGAVVLRHERKVEDAAKVPGYRKVGLKLITGLASNASLPMVGLVERVKRKKIWLLKATEEFHRPEKLVLEL